MKKGYLAAISAILLPAVIWAGLSIYGDEPAPEVTFRTIDNRKIDLHSLRGQPVLVTFWATSCRTCLREMPHLVEMYRTLADRGLEIIGVAMPYDIPSHVVQLVNKRNIPYPVVLDVDSSITSAFGNVRLTPTSFLIDPDGKIVRHRTGEINIESLRKQIITLLSRMQPAAGQLVADVL